MRINYNNIIDDATLTATTEVTGYEVENVQDQRLSTVWKTDTTSQQSCLVTLSTLSEYPDNATGTTYISHFATAGSWLGSGGVATTGTIAGVLRLTATTANSSIITTGLTIASGATLIGRFRSPSALATTLTVLRGASTVSTITGVTTSWAVYSTVLAGGATATTLSVVTNNTASSGTVLDTDWLYAGTGEYNVNSLTDNSGNGNHGTIYGATPVAVSGYGIGLKHDGVNDSEQITVSGLVYQQTILIPVQLDVRDTGGDVLYECGSIYTGGLGRVLIIANNGSAGLTTIYISTASGLSLTGSITIPDLLMHQLCVVIDLTQSVAASALKVYFDGVSTTVNFSSTDTNRPVLYNGLVNIGSRNRTSFFLSGTHANIKSWNRTLTAQEALNHYNQVEWVGQNDGLIGDWTINKDLGVNTSAILGHNILTGQTVKIMGNNSDAWDDPDVSETLTINPDTILKFFTETYYKKYWKFLFGTQGSLEIGRLWLGEYMTIDPSSLLNFSVTKNRSDQVIHGKNRQKWANIGESWRAIQLSFPVTEEAMIYQLSEMFDTVGNHSSIIFCNFDDIREYTLVEPIYCSINGPLTFDHDKRMKFTWSIELEEEK